MKTPDYSKYIKTSFAIAKKNKWLWIFGALVGAGNNLSFDWISDLAKSKVNDKPAPENLFSLPEASAKVLGSATDAIKDWVYHVPFHKWVMLVVLLIVLVAIGITAVVIIQNWARASLIKSVNKALSGKEVTLQNSSPEGFKYLKKMVLLSLLIFSLTLGLMVAVPLFWVGIYFVVQSVTILKILWFIVGGLLALIIFLITFALTTIVNIHAERFIVLKNYAVLPAFKAAFTAARRTLLPAIITGVVNFVFRIIFGIAVAFSVAVFIGLPTYLTVRAASSDLTLAIILGTATTMAFVIFIFVATLLSAAVNVFTYSNWNQLVNDYYKNQDHDSGEKVKEDNQND